MCQAVSQNFYFNYTRNISTRLVNEARFGYGRFNVNFSARDPEVEAAGPVFLFSGAGLGQGITSVGLPGLSAGTALQQLSDTRHAFIHER